VRAHAHTGTPREMGRAQVEVTNTAGDSVGIFSEEVFSDWRRSMQCKMGGKIGSAIGEQWLVDCKTLMHHLPPGRHNATLVQSMAVSRQVRQKLQGCDVWKAV